MRVLHFLQTELDLMARLGDYRCSGIIAFFGLPPGFRMSRKRSNMLIWRTPILSNKHRRCQALVGSWILSFFHLSLISQWFCLYSYYLYTLMFKNGVGNFPKSTSAVWRVRRAGRSHGCSF
jgi:hypothetical protein